MQLITLGLQYAIDVEVLLLLLPNTEIQGWCCPLKISADYTHSTKVFSFVFYDWLLSRGRFKSNQFCFLQNNVKNFFSRRLGPRKKATFFSIQKESSLVQNSINYPFDLTLDLKHDSSLKTTAENACELAATTLLLVVELVNVPMVEQLKQLMLQFLRRNRLRHTITSFHDPQMRTLYSGAGAQGVRKAIGWCMHICKSFLPSNLSIVSTHIFCCDCSHPETKPKATYIKLGVIAFRQHNQKEGKNTKF